MAFWLPAGLRVRAPSSPRLPARAPRSEDQCYHSRPQHLSALWAMLAPWRLLHGPMPSGFFLKRIGLVFLVVVAISVALRLHVQVGHTAAKSQELQQKGVEADAKAAFK